MIPCAFYNGKGPVNLLGKNQPNHLMGKGHR